MRLLRRGPLWPSKSVKRFFASLEAFGRRMKKAFGRKNTAAYSKAAVFLRLFDAMVEQSLNDNTKPYAIAEKGVRALASLV